jgi:hypothetical protein
LETTMSKDWIFREQEFVNRANRIRAKVEEGAAFGRTQVNENVISEKEYEDTKRQLVDAGNAELAKLLREREKAVSEQELALSRELAGVQNSEPGTLKEFRAAYEDLKAAGIKDKTAIINHYRTSLRLGDEVSLRACALAAHELGICEVTADFAERDPSFAETAAFAARFSKRYRDVTAKFTDRLSNYRSISAPQERREPVQSGFIIDPATGMRYPHYRNRLYKK